MTDESIARSRPKRQSTSRIQQQQQFRSSDLDESEEDVSSVISGSAVSGAEEGTTDEESDDEVVEEELSHVANSLKETNQSKKTANINEKPRKNTPKPIHTRKPKIGPKQYKDTHASRRRFKDAYTGDGSEKIFGLIPDANLVKQTRKKDDELVDAKSSYIAKLVEKCLKKKGKGIKVFTKQQSKPYLQSKGTDTEKSFLHPSDEALAYADEDNKLVAEVNFKEKVPLIGENLKVIFGTKGDMREVSLKKHQSVKLRDATRVNNKPGVAFNVGSHVYNTDWCYKDQDQMRSDDCEYLCVSAAMDEWPRTYLTERIKRDSEPGILQVWSISRSDWEANLYLKIFLEGGRMSSIRWVPLTKTFGGNGLWMGLLSVTRQDGRVDVYAVPYRESLDLQEKSNRAPTISLQPLVTFEISTGLPLCMEWLDCERVAVGYSDGHLAIWNLRESLENVLDEEADLQIARADMYIHLSRSPVTDLTWGKEGEEEIFSVAYDGSVYHTSLAFADHSTTLIRARDALHAIAFERFSNYPLCERLEDCTLRTVEYPQDARASSRMVYPHFGRIRAVDTSPHHPFVASAGADGTVRCINLSLVMCNNMRRWAGAGMINLFRLDLPDRGSNGPLQFIEPLESFASTRNPPKEILDKLKEEKKGTVICRQGLTLAWHPAVNITTICWNLNEGCETWLASGMAAGMVRIDVVGKNNYEQSESEEEEDEEEEDEEDEDEEMQEASD